jgi:hypothetical protein
MNPLQSLFVDSERKALPTFAVPEMDLSSSRSTMAKHSFVVTARAIDLIQCLAPAYSAWLDESRADDEDCGGPQDELAEAGYPSLEQVLKAPQLLRLVVGHYLLRDLLVKFTWDGSSPIEYWFDQATECHLDDQVVQISGVCYSRLVA